MRRMSWVILVYYISYHRVTQWYSCRAIILLMRGRTDLWTALSIMWTPQMQWVLMPPQVVPPPAVGPSPFQGTLAMQGLATDGQPPVHCEAAQVQGKGRKPRRSRRCRRRSSSGSSSSTMEHSRRVRAKFSPQAVARSSLEHGGDATLGISPGTGRRRRGRTPCSTLVEPALAAQPHNSHSTVGVRRRIFGKQADSMSVSVQASKSVVIEEGFLPADPAWSTDVALLAAGVQTLLKSTIDDLLEDKLPDQLSYAPLAAYAVQSVRLL